MEIIKAKRIQEVKEKMQESTRKLHLEKQLLLYQVQGTNEQYCKNYSKNFIFQQDIFNQSKFQQNIDKKSPVIQSPKIQKNKVYKSQKLS